MQKILREPLLHFLLLGAGLFAAYGLVGERPSSGEPGRSSSAPGRSSTWPSGFTRTWQRPPTQAELEGLIEDHIQEEVYYREAMALGLDQDDTIIRRRLRQKMEFITEDVAAAGGADRRRAAARYLQAHPDTFRASRRFSSARSI